MCESLLLCRNEEFFYQCGYGMTTPVFSTTLCDVHTTHTFLIHSPALPLSLSPSDSHPLPSCIIAIRFLRFSIVFHVLAFFCPSFHHPCLSHTLSYRDERRGTHAKGINKGVIIRTVFLRHGLQITTILNLRHRWERERTSEWTRQRQREKMREWESHHG